MSINERCDAEKITSLVKQHVPKAKLSRQHEAELTFTLPFESMDTFPGKSLEFPAGSSRHLLQNVLLLNCQCPFPAHAVDTK